MSRSFLVILFSLTTLSSWILARPGSLLFEGDMAFTKKQDKMVKEAIDKKIDIENASKEEFAATTKAFPKWTNAVVPYTFKSLNSRAIYAIKQAMAEWQRMTCIRFKKRTSERNYLEFFHGNGCWGHVGMGNGRTQISVGPGCAYRHVMTHEIGHAVGFFHEQSRTDRDNWITVVWSNVPSAYKEAFAKYGRDKLDSLGEPYDYGSIMHYPWNAFSTNGRNTVVPKRRVVNQPYRVLSKSDAIQANRMYNCDKTKPPRPATPVVPKTKQPPFTGPQPLTKCVIEVVEETVVIKKPTSSCTDNNHMCGSWAARGECRRNPGYMLPNCCRSCGGGSCSDGNRYCSSWARAGQCRINPRYMLVNCKKSCGRCSTTKTITKKIKKRVRKCSIVRTEPISKMPPLPEEKTTQVPPEPTTLLPPIPKTTLLPPLPTNTTETNTTKKPDPTEIPIPSNCSAYKKAGLENGSILDAALSASTSFSKPFGASKGRLNGHSAWCPSTLNEKQYLKIDLGRLAHVAEILTQGLNAPLPQYVSKYYVSYSEDGNLWNDVVGLSFWAVKEFDGNKDGKTAVKNVIQPPIIARYIKIRPVSWKNYICLRAEFNICY